MSQIQYTHIHTLTYNKYRWLKARLVHPGLYTLSMLNRFTSVRFFFFFICSLNLSIPVNPASICVWAVFSFFMTAQRWEGGIQDNDTGFCSQPPFQVKAVLWLFGCLCSSEQVCVDFEACVICSQSRLLETSCDYNSDTVASLAELTFSLKSASNQRNTTVDADSWPHSSYN